jgi:hypothetical protein
MFSVIYIGFFKEIKGLDWFEMVHVVAESWECEGGGIGENVLLTICFR